MSKARMSKVVVSEWIDAAAAERLREHHDVVADADLHADRRRLFDTLADAEGWVVRNQTRVDLGAVVAAPRLRVLGRVGVGLDSIDVPALRDRGVVVTWAPGANAVSVAEYVLGAMLSHARRYAEATAHIAQGGWDRRRFVGYELRGRTLGLVGLGDIGARLARRARALGMRVIAHDPALNANSAAVQENEVALVDLGTLLASSDVISLHAPLLPTTKGLIGAAQLRRMRHDALLINTSRGALVDEGALAAALRAGAIGGAVLDVRDPEPPDTDDALRDCPNITLTPHVAGVTRESDARASWHVVEDVMRVLRGDRATTPVPV